MPKRPEAAELMEIGKQCFCFQSRMTARELTRLYNAGLAPAGLEVTEFSLLAIIRLEQPKSVLDLAERFGFERTTLVRNLKHLEGRGLIEAKPSGGRARVYGLTEAGDILLAEAIPFWRAVQAEIANTLGEGAPDTVLGALKTLRKAARVAG